MNNTDSPRSKVYYIPHIRVGWIFKEAKSVTVNIFRKKYFPFKSFVKIELSYVFTIDLFSAAETA